MPNIQFFALAESVCKKLNLPPIPFPVRKGRDEIIFNPQGVALDLLLDELEQYLNTTIKEILKGGPKSLSGSKKLINDVMQNASVKEKLIEVPKILANVRVSPEAREGFKAFLEKRNPNW